MNFGGDHVSDAGRLADRPHLAPASTRLSARWETPLERRYDEVERLYPPMSLAGQRFTALIGRP